MYRIGIITADPQLDWASRELLDAANLMASGALVDPISFDISVDGASSIRIQGEQAEAFDGLIVRGFNRSGEIDYQYEIFEILSDLGWPVINHPHGLSCAESKAHTTFCLQRAGLPVPRTVVTQDLDEAACAVREFGEAVLKPLYGSHGVGIERLRPETSSQLLPPFLDAQGVLYVQEFVPNEGRDIRAFVVGDELPAAMYRVAREGEWKTNVYQGSSCEPCELSPQLRGICLEAARVVGLDYTGVDIIDGPDGPVILELNGAPSWYGLLEATGRNVAADVVCHMLHLLDTGKPARRPAGFRSRQRTSQNRTVHRGDGFRGVSDQ